VDVTIYLSHLREYNRTLDRVRAIRDAILNGQSFLNGYDKPVVQRPKRFGQPEAIWEPSPQTPGGKVDPETWPSAETIAEAVAALEVTGKQVAISYSLLSGDDRRLVASPFVTGQQ
jgi:hypothetical protein